MKIEEVVKAVDGILLCGNNHDEIKGVTQDTRKINPGDLYVPIIGEVFDGHQFINQAFEKGAIASLTSNKEIDLQKNMIYVQDTHDALGKLAHYVRKKHDVKVVGITGSVGKTSTKDMIASVVSQKYKTLKTLGNYNNDIGLPLTILRYQDEEVLVLEMGMNHLNEIDYLTKIASPDIAVITNVGSAHIGELGSRENILKAKMEITHGLDNGTLIINNDNDMLQTVTNASNYELLKVGIENESLLPVKQIEYDDHGSKFVITYKNQDYPVNLSIPGKHFILNALLAIQVGLLLEISINDCIVGVETFKLTKNRNDIIQLKENSLLIDGTYNANLDSMKASLDVLNQYQNYHKIAVLSDMLELGSFEYDLHKQVGEYINTLNIDEVFLVGKASKVIHEVVKNSYYFSNNEELYQALTSHIQKQSAILVKGSNGMHLNEVVAKIKENFQ